MSEKLRPWEGSKLRGKAREEGGRGTKSVEDEIGGGEELGSEGDDKDEAGEEEGM